MDGRMTSETVTSGPTTNVRPRPKLPSTLTSHAKPLDRFYTEDNHNTCNSNFLLHQQPQQQQHEQKMADSEYKLEQPFANLSGKYRRPPAAPTGRASFNSSPYLAGLAASPLPVKPPSSCPPKLLQEICEQVSDTDDMPGRQTEAWYAHASDDEVLKSERTRTFSIQPGLDSSSQQEHRFDHPRGVSTLPRNQSMSAYDRSSNRDYIRPCSRRLNRRVVERSDTNLGVTNEWQTPQTWADIGHANSDPSRRDMYVKPIGGLKDPSSMSVSEDMFDERAMGLRKQVHRSPSDVANAVVRSFSLRKPKNIEKLVLPHCFTPAAGNGTDTGKNGDVIHNDCKGSVQKTEDEGVGAVDLEEQSFSDAYIAVIHGSKQTPGEGALDSAGKHQLRDDVWQTHLGGRNDEGLPTNNRRGQRYVDQSTGSGVRETASRFLTHPPVREKSLTRETGSIDSNGLGSLKNNNGKIDSPDGAVPPSSVCSLDSHLCQSEAASDVTSALHVEFELSSDNNGGRLDRRNSKTLKQKSKSDPSGEKTTNTDSLDLQNLVCYGVYAHSSPLLLEKEKHQFPFTDRDDSSSIGPERTSSFEDVLASADPASAGSGYDSPCGSGTGIPASNQDIKIKVVLKSDDSFDDGANSLPPVVKPPRPRAPKRKSRAASTAAAAAAAAAADAANSPAEARKTTHVMVPPQKENSNPENDSAFKEDATPTRDVRGRETSRRGTTEGGGKSGGSGGGGVKIFSPMSALTLPLIKKSTLLRSHSTTSPDRPAGESPPRRSNGGLQQEHHKTPPPVAGRHASGDSANMFVSAGGGSIPELFSHKSKTTSYSSTASYSYSPSLDLSRSNLTLFGGASEDKEKRDFILQEFYNSEQDYVETLQMLVEKYMIPMKTQNVIDNSLTDEIFYKINEIYMHHATFITFLAKELQTWDSKSTIGNVIYKNFSKQTVIDSYISFIEHFPRAEKVLDEISTKSSFQKFIEVCERETKTKLPLKAQIVKPAQRIPRYELLIRRLLENTPPDHPDFALLEQAGKTIHELALKINSAKESKHEEEFQETLKKLELLLITDLVGPYRQYIRHDLVLIADKKDQCCLWLFSDLVIFSFLKRKSTNVNRRTSLLLQSPSGHDFVENTKHKVWLKLSLDAIDIAQVEEEQDPDHQLVDKEELEEDFQTLEQMTELSSRLKLPHQPLDDAVTEMLTQINKQLSEHQLKTPPPEEHALELITNTPEGLLNIVVLFPSADKKNSWEASFIQYKQKFGSVSDNKQPEFMHLLSITKTRAGMQFICATPTEPSSKRPHPEVLVCNSDGHYGHVCLLSLQEPEPMVTLNTPVPGCNARILCMCAVPPDCQPSKRMKTARRYGVGKTDAPLIRIEETKDDIEDVYVSDSTSDSSMDEDGEDGDKRHFQPLPELESGETPPSKECSIIDRDKGTVWFGTEDGWICIFASTDNIKTTKNKLKISVSSSVLSIVNLDQTVFASLENGDIVVFTRNAEDGSWNEDCASEILAVSNSSAPITKMMPVSGKLWCACLNDILVLDVTTRNVETRFSINQDTQKRGINCMTWSPTVGVWIAGNGSSSILLFHASTYEQLLEVNVANAVALRLQATDDIIRQHKMACLRITALLSCKDLLWIGTSAGVILTLPIPKTTISLTMPTPKSLDYGHTGHVRFLTSVDMPTQVRSGQGRQRSESTGSTGGTGGSAKASYTGKTASSPGNVVVVVVSGGDGTENFKSPTGDSDEPAGKEDSTNHLLLWKV